MLSARAVTACLQLAHDREAANATATPESALEQLRRRASRNPIDPMIANKDGALGIEHGSDRPPPDPPARGSTRW